MNILLYEHNYFTTKKVVQSLKKIGHHITIYSLPLKNYDEDIEFMEKFRGKLIETKYDMVFCMNFVPIISEICNELKLKYVCWIGDCPALTLYSKTIYNKCNFVFLFDKGNYERLKKYNVDTIYYLPLAGWIDEKELEINQNFQSEVSFLGTLYQNCQYDKIQYCTQYITGYLDGVINAQLGFYKHNILEDSLSNDIINRFKKYVKFNMGENYFISDSQMISDIFLANKCTQIDRIQTLTMLSEKFKVDLYTGSDTTLLPNIQNKGYVDYDEVMPTVFKGSKINLNITIRSIRTGIPLRVFDIMSVGGFVISNYQPEIEELFIPGKEIVLYDSLNELMEKIQYYLEHDDERMEIAYNGYKKIKEKYTYEIQLSKILDIVENTNCF